MALLEHMCQKGTVPDGTKNEVAKQLRDHLYDRLLVMLSTMFIWRAMASRAVDAGNR